MIRRQFLILTAISGLITPAAFASEPKKKGGGEGYTQFKTINVFTQASRREASLSSTISTLTEALSTLRNRRCVCECCMLIGLKFVR